MDKMFMAIQQEKSNLISEGKKIYDLAESEKRDLTEMEKSRDDEINARLQILNADIQRHEARRERERSSQAMPRIELHERIDDDPKRGFADIADFAIAVKSMYTPGGAIDDRLKIGAAPTNFHQETGSNEGRMVPPAFRQEVWEVANEEEALLPETDNEPTNSNSVEFLRDETTPWGTTGVQAKWRGEAVQMEPSKLVTNASQMMLHELYAFVTATEQLLADAPRLATRLTKKAGQAIRWKVNDAIVNGTGVAQPKGFFKSNSLVSVAKEGSQVADTVVAANVAKMFSRVINPSKAIWYANQDVLPQIMVLAIGNQPVWTPPNSGFSAAPGGWLLGRPVRFCESCQTIGDKGDIFLANLKDGYYAVTSEGGIQFASSIHLYFDYGLQAFRWTFRMNGQPYLSAPISPKNGSNTRSHFVTLDTRA